MIDIRDVLTLSDSNKYVVANKIEYEGKEYLYLVDINDNSNVKFCYLDNYEVVISNNKELNTHLLCEFYKNTKRVLDILENE